MRGPDLVSVVHVLEPQGPPYTGCVLRPAGAPPYHRHSGEFDLVQSHELDTFLGGASAGLTT